MKLETLEHFINKEQDLWKREDIDKVIGKYGKNAIFYDTDGITNRLVRLFKFRDMSTNDKTISNFVSNKNNDYIYVINYLKDYIDTIDFIFWPSETALQVIYKILCNRILSDEKLKEYSEEYISLKQLAQKISLLRYDWHSKSKTENKKKEDSNESK